MVRKLETYQTSLGFFDPAIAAPPMKAALEVAPGPRGLTPSCEVPLAQSGFSDIRHKARRHLCGAARGYPPLIAWSTDGDGSIGSPSAHIRSFQLSQSSLSAVRIRDSPLLRVSTDCAARMLVIARALPSSLFRALRSPPESGVGWCLGAIRTSVIQAGDRRCRQLLERGPAAVFFVT